MTPSSGDQTTISRFSNITDIPLGYKGIVKINGNFNGGNFIPFCYSLRRINFKIGENSYDPNTTLLITSTKSISGFYELDGETFSRGPFMFIVKAWLRK
jgi:hypothetical protein